MITIQINITLWPPREERPLSLMIPFDLWFITDRLWEPKTTCDRFEPFAIAQAVRRKAYDMALTSIEQFCDVCVVDFPDSRSRYLTGIHIRSGMVWNRRIGEHFV